jgi:hypothetical protein
MVAPGLTEQLMPLTLVLALQAAAATAPPTSPPFLDLDFDLARYNAELGLDDRGCNRSDPSAIIVCARRPGGGAYPLAQMARIFEPGRLIAETHLTGNLTGNVHVERGDIAADRGAVPQRIMVGLRLPF